MFRDLAQFTLGVEGCSIHLCYRSCPKMRWVLAGVRKQDILWARPTLQAQLKFCMHCHWIIRVHNLEVILRGQPIMYPNYEKVRRLWLHLTIALAISRLASLLRCAMPFDGIPNRLHATSVRDWFMQKLILRCSKTFEQITLLRGAVEACPQRPQHCDDTAIGAGLDSKERAHPRKAAHHQGAHTSASMLLLDVNFSNQILIIST